jgi:hypothetical protein
MKTGGPREALAKGWMKTFAPEYFSTVTACVGERSATPAMPAERARQQIQDGN